MKIAVLTCTGGRQESFNLTCKFMAAQSRVPDLWVVVDDVDPATLIPPWPFIRVLRPEPRWRQGGPHTLRRNFIEGLLLIKESGMDLVTVMEDDDWYSPDYLWVMSEHVRTSRAEIIGERNTIYYHVGARQWKQNWHPGHASLCSVSFSTRLIDDMIQITEGVKNAGIDFAIFRQDWYEGCVKLLDTHHCVGIKGLPADRAGIGYGHRRLPHSGIPDPDLHKLEELTGEDAQLYAEYRWPLVLPPPPKGAEEHDPPRNKKKNVPKGRRAADTRPKHIATIVETKTVRRGSQRVINQMTPRSKT